MLHQHHPQLTLSVLPLCTCHAVPCCVVLCCPVRDHSLQLQATCEAAQRVEEEHTEATKQIADIQAQLDELKREKHELFQQLKLVGVWVLWGMRGVCVFVWADGCFLLSV